MKNKLHVILVACTSHYLDRTKGLAAVAMVGAGNTRGSMVGADAADLATGLVNALAAASPRCASSRPPPPPRRAAAATAAAGAATASSWPSCRRCWTRS